MGALTKADLAEQLFDQLGLNKGKQRSCELFFEEISSLRGQCPKPNCRALEFELKEKKVRTKSKNRRRRSYISSKR